MKNKAEKFISNILFLFIFVPSCLLILFFLVIPVFVTLQYSLTNMSLVGQSNVDVSFIGIDNYVRLFTSGIFYKSLTNTLLLVICSAIIGQQCIGFGVAYLLQFTNHFFRKIVRFSLSMGWLLPEIVVAFIFFYLFSAEGLINTFVYMKGYSGVSWLHRYGMLIILLADIWRNVAFSVTTYEGFFSSLQSEWYEAASIDGASFFQKKIKITLPHLIKPALSSILFCVLRTIGMFSLIFLLTGGGPANSTNTLSLYIFQNTIAVSTIGYGAAIGFSTFIILSIISFMFVTVNNERSSYE